MCKKENINGNLPKFHVQKENETELDQHLLDELANLCNVVVHISRADDLWRAVYKVSINGMLCTNTTNAPSAYPSCIGIFG